MLLVLTMDQPCAACVARVEYGVLIYSSTWQVQQCDHKYHASVIPVSLLLVLIIDRTCAAPWLVSLLLMAPIFLNLERFDFEQEELPERRLLGVYQAQGLKECVYRQQPHFHGNIDIVSTMHVMCIYLGVVKDYIVQELNYLFSDATNIYDRI